MQELVKKYLKKIGSRKQAKVKLSAFALVPLFLLGMSLPLLQASKELPAETDGRLPAGTAEAVTAEADAADLPETMLTEALSTSQEEREDSEDPADPYETERAAEPEKRAEAELNESTEAAEAADAAEAESDLTAENATEAVIEDENEMASGRDESENRAPAEDVRRAEETPARSEGPAPLAQVNTLSDTRSGDQALKDYITSVKVKKEVDGKLVSTGTVADNEKVLIDIQYTVDAGTLSYESGRTDLVYPMPAGVIAKQGQSGILYDNGKEAGTYTIEGNSIRLSFNEEYSDGHSFSGFISFESRIDKDQADDDGKIRFIGKDDEVIKEIEIEDSEMPAEYDIYVDKAKTGEISETEDGRKKASYTVQAGSWKGTESSVTISDKIKADSIGEFSYVKDSVEVILVDYDGVQTVVDPSDYTLTFAGGSGTETPESFTVEGLPQLAAGEKYLLNYDVINTEKAADGSAVLNNFAQGESGDKKDRSDHWQEMLPPAVDKHGQYLVNRDIVKWTLVINNPDQEDLGGWKLFDHLPEGINVIGSIKVEVKDEHWQTVGEIAAEEVINGYTIPEGYSGKQYRFTYYTDAPEAAPGEQFSLTNSMSISKDGESYESSDTLEERKKNWNVSKHLASEDKTGEGERSLFWNSRTELPHQWESFVFKDFILDPQVQGDSPAENMKHYAYLGELKEAIASSLRFVPIEGEPYGPELYEEYFEVEVKYYDAFTIDPENKYQPEGLIAPDADPMQEVKSFTVEVRLKEGKDPSDFKAMTISSYPTHAEFSDLAIGDEVIFKNRSEVNDRHVEAEKRIKKNKMLEKFSGLWRNYFSGGHEYNKIPDDKHIDYRILITPDPGENGDIVLYDYLPEHTSLVKNHEDKSINAFFLEGKYTPHQEYKGENSYSFEPWGANYQEVLSEITEKDGQRVLKITIPGGYAEALEENDWAICIEYRLSFADDPTLNHPTEWQNYHNRVVWEAKDAEAESETSFKKRLKK